MSNLDQTVQGTYPIIQHISPLRNQDGGDFRCPHEATLKNLQTDLRKATGGEELHILLGLGIATDALRIRPSGKCAAQSPGAPKVCTLLGGQGTQTMQSYLEREVVHASV